MSALTSRLVSVHLVSLVSLVTTHRPRRPHHRSRTALRQSSKPSWATSVLVLRPPPAMVEAAHGAEDAVAKPDVGSHDDP